MKASNANYFKKYDFDSEGNKALYKGFGWTKYLLTVLT